MNENPYKSSMARSAVGLRRRRISPWVFRSISLISAAVALWMAYGAAYSLWLNAHPLHDDEYWAHRFYQYSVGFLVSVCVAVLSLVLSSRRRDN